MLGSLSLKVPQLLAMMNMLGDGGLGIEPRGPPDLPHPQVKANKHSPHLSRLQECSRTVNEMAANVVASTKSGQEQIEDRGEC